MATNYKPNGKRGRGRPAKVVKYHKAKRQYFATLQVGGRTEYFYGATEPEALEKYTQRREQLQRPIRGLTDTESDRRFAFPRRPANGGSLPCFLLWRPKMWSELALTTERVVPSAATSCVVRATDRPAFPALAMRRWEFAAPRAVRPRIVRLLSHRSAGPRTR